MPARCRERVDEVAMRKVLVPTDSSEGSLDAVRQAITLAKAEPGTKVRVVNVQPALSSAVTTFIEKGSVADYHREQGDAEIAAAKELLQQAGIEFETAVLVGSTAERIVEDAIEQGCERIIMGTRGMSALPSLLLGSVASRVRQLATIPVTLVK
jgi:nucleotide-binding universal stress UspA family protein